MWRPTSEAVLKLDFIIVGGGLSGLASAHALASSGHRVRVFEQSADPTLPYSSAFRLPPNGTKIMEKWGILEELIERGTKLTGCKFIDLETGESLGYLQWSDKVCRELGGPAYSIFHNDLHKLLTAAALKSGVEIVTGATVEAVIPPSQNTDSPSSAVNGSHSKTSIKLASGELHSADIVIGADGHQSIVRRTVEEVPEAPRTGRVVYNGVIPHATMMGDERLKEVTRIGFPVWMGDLYYAHAYSACHDEYWSFNFWQVEDPNDDAPSGWGTSLPTSRLNFGEKLDPRLQAVIDHIRSLERVSSDVPPIATSWVDKSETMLLVGEAAHPLPPCSQPGAAIALEDACFLGTLFSHLRHPSQIPTFLYAFEDVRRPRATRLHDSELDNQTILSLPPGPAKDARNATWKEQEKVSVDKDVLSAADGSAGSSDGDDMSSETENLELRRQWLEFYENWGYDAQDAANSWWVEWGLLRERAEEAARGVNGHSDDGAAGDARGLGVEREVVVTQHD